MYKLSYDCSKIISKKIIRKDGTSMFYLALNDATLFQLPEEPVVTSTKLKGETLKALSISIQESDAATIKAAFGVEFNVRTVTVMSENKKVMSKYDGYTVLRSIAEEMDAGDNTIYTVILAMPSDLSAIVPVLQDRIAELENEVIALNSKDVVDPNTMGLDELKAYLIKKTKTDLEAYLAANPVSSTAHKNTAALYACTAEKQALLTSAIAIAQLQAAAGNTAYQPSWNATGAECTYDWTLEELVALAMDIEATVHPLVTAQQKMEVFIKNASDTATLLAKDFSFPPAGDFAPVSD